MYVYTKRGGIPSELPMLFVLTLTILHCTKQKLLYVYLVRVLMKIIQKL